jgi:hypothetical protein
MDVKLSGVFLLTFGLENFVTTKCRLIFQLMIQVGFSIYVHFFHNDQEISLTDDLHYFKDLIYGPNGMTILLKMLREIWIRVWCLQDRKLFLIWFYRIFKFVHNPGMLVPICHSYHISRHSLVRKLDIFYGIFSLHIILMLVVLNNVTKNFISLPTYVKEIHLLFLLLFVCIWFPSF